LVGGYGWFVGAHGMAVDDILEVEIVLADGRVVRASDNNNPDLFWAIRGAGPAFGIVTQFVMRTHPQPNLVWYGKLVLKRTDLDAILGITDKVAGKGNSEGLAGMIVMWLMADNGPVIAVSVFYNGPMSDAEAFFKPLLDRNPAVNTAKMVHFADSCYTVPPLELRNHSAGGSLMAPFDKTFFGELWDMFFELERKGRRRLAFSLSRS
jgi:hypothetical protein